jgi:hypothetical protein
MFIRIIFSLSLLFLISCSEDECKGRESFEIFPEVKEAIPYFDGDIVRFIGNDGSAFSVTVERVLEVTTPDMPFICDELLTVELREGANDIPFIEFVQRGSTQDLVPVVQITVFFNREGEGNTSFISINDDDSLTTPFSGTPVFHNSIVFGNNDYNDVLEINYETSLDDDSIVQLFYNQMHGLLQYTTREGLVIDLDR